AFGHRFFRIVRIYNEVLSPYFIFLLEAAQGFADNLARIAIPPALDLPMNKLRKMRRDGDIQLLHTSGHRVNLLYLLTIARLSPPACLLQLLLLDPDTEEAIGN